MHDVGLECGSLLQVDPLFGSQFFQVVAMQCLIDALVSPVSLEAEEKPATDHQVERL